MLEPLRIFGCRCSLEAAHVHRTRKKPTSLATTSPHVGCCYQPARSDICLQMPSLEICKPRALRFRTVPVAMYALTYKTAEYDLSCRRRILPKMCHAAGDKFPKVLYRYGCEPSGYQPSHPSEACSKDLVHFNAMLSRMSGEFHSHAVWYFEAQVRWRASCEIVRSEYLCFNSSNNSEAARN